MKKLPFIAAFLFALCVSSFGQKSSPIPSCPSISVLAPAYLPDLDKPVTFSGVITGDKQARRLTYHWMLTGGRIMNGQGTKLIQVKTYGDVLTATLQISGLPKGCNTSATASAPID
jgi:hypothetical protein